MSPRPMSPEPGVPSSRTPGRPSPTAGPPSGRSAGGEPSLRRAFAASPLAVAVVRGPTHVLAYANAAFGALMADGGPAVGAVLGGPIASVFSATAALSLLALLDRARRTQQPERGAIPVAPPGPTGAADDAGAAGTEMWPVAAWPTAGARAGSASDALVVAVDTSREAADTRVQRRTIAERLLLSAFREGTRADDADTARTVAEDANAARGRALAATSHELRTPLQAIGGYAELLDMGLHGPVTDAQRGALARIQQAMQHLLGVTTTLLHQSQVDAGPVPYVITDVLAAVVLHEAVALVTPQAAARGIALTAGPCAMTVVGRADAGKLRQVLVNLLANAVKFTAAGGTVTAACAFEVEDAPSDRARRREDRAGARVVLRVSDTGSGIAADQLARVFDPYVQVGPRLTTHDAGVGLGLAISRELARGMGGDLTAESTPGSGSTFTLTLPAA